MQISCPQCQQRYAYEPRLAGKQLKCQKCGGAIAVPAAPVPPRAQRLDESAAARIAQPPVTTSFVVAELVEEEPQPTSPFDFGDAPSKSPALRDKAPPIERAQPADERSGV